MTQGVEIHRAFPLVALNRAGHNLPHFAGEKGIELIKPTSGMFIFFPPMSGMEPFLTHTLIAE